MPPAISGPETYSPQFTIDPDGLVRLTTDPFPVGGGTVTGPVVINTPSSPALTVIGGGNVGIGTPTPTRRLEVNGAADTSVARFFNNGSTTGGGLFMLSISDNGNLISSGSEFSGGVWVARAANASIINLASTGGISFYGDTGLTPGSTYTPTQRIQMGPTGLLTVNAAIRTVAAGNLFGAASGNMNAPTPTNTNLLLYDGGATNWAGIGSHTDGSIYFVSGPGAPATRVVINAQGFTGIGTTTPQCLFHVHIGTDRNIQFRYGGAGESEIRGVNDIANTYTHLGINGAPVTINASGNGNVAIGTVFQSARLTIQNNAGAVAVLALQNPDFVSGSTGTSLFFDFGVASGATYSRVSALTGGNLAWGTLALQEGGGLVGVGTVSATAKLHVHSGGNTQARISSGFNNSTATGLIIDTLGDTSVGNVYFQKNSSTRGAIAYGHAASGGGERIIISVAGADILSINTAGLTVAGSVATAGNFNASGPGAGVQLYDRAGNGNYTVFYRDTNVTSIWDNTAGSVISFTPTANVGIGTTTPHSRLEIASSTVVGQSWLNTTDAVDQKFWDMVFQGGSVQFRLINDLYNTGNTWLQVDRSGTTSVNMYHSATNHYFRSSTGFTILSFNSTNAAAAINFLAGADNAYTLGASPNRWSSVWSATGTIQTSDAREKEDIRDSDLGLDFVRRLEPVSWRWRTGGNRIAGHDRDGNPIVETVPGVRRHYGLLGQQVREALGPTDFGGWILADPSDPDSEQSLRMDQFIAPLVASIKELANRLETLEGR